MNKTQASSLDKIFLLCTGLRWAIVVPGPQQRRAASLVEDSSFGTLLRMGSWIQVAWSGGGGAQVDPEAFPVGSALFVRS